MPHLPLLRLPSLAFGGTGLQCLAICFVLLAVAGNTALAQPDTYEPGYSNEYRSWSTSSCQSASGALNDRRPQGVGWSLTIGVPFLTVGRGLFDERLDRAGWAIEATVRQPIYRSSHRLQPFLQFGGLFMQNFGDDTFEITSGTFVERNRQTGNAVRSVDLDNFFESTIEDLRRGAAQAAIGATIRPCCPRHHHGCNSKYLEVLAGIRVGHVRAKFSDDPARELQDEIDQVDTANNTFDLFSDVRNTDTLYGLYTSIAVRFSPRQCDDIHSWHGPSVKAGLVYDHSWFDLGDFGRDDSGLGTLSALLTVSFLH